MRVIVAPHDLQVGGSQINAIDLAAGVRDLGHEVLIYAGPGPLVEHVERRGLEFLPAPTQEYRPAPQRIVNLARLARKRGIDLIHGYEWPPCLDAYFGANLAYRIPVLCTVLSMSVPTLVPPSIPLIMGTEALASEARAAGFHDVSVGEPPIDTEGDHPRIDGTGIRRRYGIGDDEGLVVTVTRLSTDLKLDALGRAIDAIDELAKHQPVRLLIVGGGEAENQLRERAARLNRAAGRELVLLAGQQLDPRAFYAAADVVVGMGSSALRAMSIGRPLVVQGQRGFSLTCEPETLPLFLHQGFWGVGSGEAGSADLAGQIGQLLIDPPRRRRLSSFGREVVEKRFALARATEVMAERYAQIIAGPVGRRPLELVQVGLRAARAELQQHDPREKRSRARAEQTRLAAARGASPERDRQEIRP